MKRNLLRSLILVLAVLMCASFACAATSCDKGSGTPAPDTSREDARAAFVTAALSARSDAWSGDFDNAKIALLSDCGDYVVAYHWINFAADVLYDSSLTTANLQLVVKAVESQTGKDVISDAEHNSGKLLTLLKDTGLTSIDVENLVYDGVLALVGADAVFDKCIAQLNEIKLIPQSSDARDNLNAAFTASSSGKEAFKSVAASAAAIKASVESAESGIKSLVSATYRSAMLFDGNGDFLTKLTSGTLSGATEEEIAVYLGSMLSGVSDLKYTLTETELASLVTALGLIVNNMGDVLALLSSNLTSVNRAFSYLPTAVKAAYLTVGYLPVFCNVIERAGNFLLAEKDGAYPQISALMTALTDGEYKEATTSYNTAIPVARILLRALGIDYAESDPLTLATQISASEDWVHGLVDGLSPAADDYQKKLVLLYLDSVVNRDAETPAHISAADYSAVLNAVTIDLMLQSFKSDFYIYAGGDTTKEVALRNKAKMFANYGASGISSDATITTEWYRAVVSATRAKLTSSVNALLPAVIADIKATVTDLYGEPMTKLIGLANRSLAKTDTAEYAELQAILTEMGLVELFESDN